MTQLYPAQEFCARHVCWINVCSSAQYDMPRHALDPPQWGCISKMPLCAAHIEAN
jgi:hypothetical protein